jgi:DNA-binding Xre family transcriptional regulator
LAKGLRIVRAWDLGLQAGLLVSGRKGGLAQRWRTRLPLAMPKPVRAHSKPVKTHSRYFSGALASVMQSRGVNQVQLAGNAGMAISRINNYLHGNYRSVTIAHLAAICKALDGTPADTAALIQAYAYDLLPAGCRGMVDIRVLGARETGYWEVPSVGLPQKFAAEFADLYKLSVGNSNVRQRTGKWVQLMRETRH